MTIHVRVVPKPDDEGELIEYGAGDYVERFSQRASDLGDAIREVTQSMASQFADLAASGAATDWSLNEVQLKFSLDLEAEAGVVIAKAKTTAGFEMSLTWKRDPG